MSYALWLYILYFRLLKVVKEPKVVEKEGKELPRLEEEKKKVKKEEPVRELVQEENLHNRSMWW